MGPHLRAPFSSRGQLSWRRDPGMERPTQEGQPGPSWVGRWLRSAWFPRLQGTPRRTGLSEEAQVLGGGGGGVQGGDGGGGTESPCVRTGTACQTVAMS